MRGRKKGERGGERERARERDRDRERENFTLVRKVLKKSLLSPTGVFENRTT